nr:hypothetical protein Itr_chr12CG28440 [Ipomoea trifida]
MNSFVAADCPSGGHNGRSRQTKELFENSHLHVPPSGRWPELRPHPQVWNWRSEIHFGNRKKMIGSERRRKQRVREYRIGVN